jgi:hypothetical protein
MWELGVVYPILTTPALVDEPGVRVARTLVVGGWLRHSDNLTVQLCL